MDLRYSEGCVRAHQYSGYVRLTRAGRGDSAGIIQLMNRSDAEQLA